MSRRPRERAPDRRTRPAGCSGSRPPRRCPREELGELQIERLRATLRERLRQRPVLPQEAGRGRASTPGDVTATATSPTCPSPPRSTCATTTRSACSRGRARRSCACTPAPARPATRPPSGTRAPTSTLWADLIARTLAAGGVAPGDLLQNAFGYGLFTGGLGLHLGAERLGCTVRAHLRRQHRAAAQDHARLRRHGPELHAVVRACTWPTRRATAGCGPRTCRCASASTAPSRGPTRCACRSRQGSASTPSTSTASPRWAARASAFECLLQGRHARQRGPLPGRDHRPRDAAAAARGRGRRARLHDPLAAGPAAHPLPHARPVQPHLRACACGRTSVRMSKPIGRSDDMLIIRGVNVFPSQIEEVLMSIPDDRAALPDRRRPQGLPRRHRGLGRGGRGHLRRDHGRPGALPAKACRRRSTTCSTSRWRCKLKEPKTIQRSEGKAVRVVDRRKDVK